MSKNPCEGCAFTPGSAAHQEPHNFLKGLICVLGPLPFYCHHLQNGKDITSDEEYHERMTRSDIREAGMQICAGWRREVAQLAATGYFKDRPMVTQAFARAGLDALYIFLNAEDGSEDKQEAGERLQKVMERLGAKRRKFQGEK